MSNLSLYDVIKDFGIPILIAAMGSLTWWVRTLYIEMRNLRDRCSSCQLENEKRYGRKEEIENVNKELKEVKNSINDLYTKIIDKIGEMKDDIMDRISEFRK